MTKAALVTLHGMGDTQPGYAAGMVAKLRARLGASAGDVIDGSVFYQHELQLNQEQLWDRSIGAHRLDWHWVRRFILFNLSDAVGIEAGKDEPDSSYQRTQELIARTLLEMRRKAGPDAPVVVVAHSLGGQVFSCYLYDAQAAQRVKRDPRRRMPPAGIWRRDKASLQEALGQALSDDEVEYLRGSTLSALITIGCNIPVFVAAHARMSIVPIAPPNVGFEWHNYFDRDDVLGWPLQPLSDGYRDLVHDHGIDAGGLLRGWNWLSHSAYWTDGDVIDAVASQLRRALGKPTARPAATPRPQPEAV